MSRLPVLVRNPISAGGLGLFVLGNIAGSQVVAGNPNAAPVAPSRSHIVATLTDSTFWPEGMDFDQRTGRYYVASVRHRTIAEVANGRVRRELWPREQRGIGAVLGVRVDSRRGVLWATLAGIPQMKGFAARDSMIAALVRVRLTDGKIVRRWDLPPATRSRAWRSRSRPVRRRIRDRLEGPRALPTASRRRFTRANHESTLSVTPGHGAVA